MVSRQAWKRWGTVVATAAFGFLLTGCVERRYTIRSDPPGALVVVNGEEIGRAPVSRNFTYYGDRDISLMLDGYQTQRVIQPIKARWFDNLATEFFTENVIPYTFRDERDFTYKMTPATVPMTNDLLTRGSALRSQAGNIPPPRRGGFLGWLGF
jgi:PEGA domain